MSKPRVPCEKCQFLQLSELETPCINCVHNHLGGSYPDYFQVTSDEPDPAPDPHKDDDGKPKISLVPTDIIREVAKIEEYDQKAEKLCAPKMLCKTRKVSQTWKGLFECPYCGKEFEAFITNVVRGKTKSCGCAKGRLSIKARGTHGGSKTRLYRIWKHINERCNSPTCKEFKWYGARGIECKFDSFEEFRDFAMNNGYNDNLTCERIDVNGDYEPGNLTFIPARLQARNKRSNIRITYKGLTLCASEWAEIMGVNQNTITSRIRKGWSAEKTIETPVKGSVDMSLVPVGIIEAIRETRLYGLVKYPETGMDGWRKIGKQRIRDAMLRHCLRYIEEPGGVDSESGLSHLSHLATNVAFLIEMEGIGDVETD